MRSFAVLLTCFNRKEKTLSCLKSLEEAFSNVHNDYQMDIFLTDDGSKDGTSEAVEKKFPYVKIIQGNGSLYWAGGMRNSWKEAIKNNYDAYLLLNDDTNVAPTLFEAIYTTDNYCKSTYDKKGVYIGTTIDSETKKLTYGGSIFVNRFLAKIKKLMPSDGKPIPCDLGNANIMWVDKSVVNGVGILSEGYVHGMADYDYTMKASKNDFPVLVMPGIVGQCTNDHTNKYLKFSKLILAERLKMLYDPIGLDFKSQLHHMKKHFPLRFPLFFLMGYFKVLFPRYYYNKFYKNRT